MPMPVWPKIEEGGWGMLKNYLGKNGRSCKDAGRRGSTRSLTSQSRGNSKNFLDFYQALEIYLYIYTFSIIVETENRYGMLKIMKYTQYFILIG